MEGYVKPITSPDIRHRVVVLAGDAVVRAARMLVKTAHSDILPFLVLKLEGASETTDAVVKSTNEPSQGLKFLCEIGPGFQDFVRDNFDRLPEREEEPGLAVRPQGSGDYPFFFPIVDRGGRFLLRRADSQRSVVWTRLTDNDWKTGGRNGIVPYQQIVEVADRQVGLSVRLRSGYIGPLGLYCSLEEGVLCSIPWEPFVLWLCRNQDFDHAPDFAELEGRARELARITGEEREFLFRSVGQAQLGIGPDSFVASRSQKEYYRRLLFDPISLTAPSGGAIELVGDNVEEKLESYAEIRDAFGFGEEADPEELAGHIVEMGGRSLLFVGPPRTSKTYVAERIAAKYLGLKFVADVDGDARVLHLQFHREWKYSDFIERQVPTLDNGKFAIKREPSRFVVHVNEHADGKSVVILEELNRANIPAVLGEVLHLIEEPYRGRRLTLPSGKEISIPKDLLVIATANNLDRSTYPIDFALIGRFRTVEFRPSYRRAVQILHEGNLGQAEISRILTAIQKLVRITSFPVGHAYLVGVKSIVDFQFMYDTKLRPALSIFLGQRLVDRLAQCDEVIRSL